MIEILEGFGLGAGKSYTTIVAKLIPHFCNGGTAYVVDTMQVKWDNLREHVSDQLGYILFEDQLQTVPEEAIPTLHEHTPPGTADCPVLIVADEVQGQMNARDWNDKNKRGLFQWATQSRHDDNDLWLISQSAMNIDKQMRRLATYNWRVRNTEAMGENILRSLLHARSTLTGGIFPPAYFILSQLDQDGKTPMGKKRWLEQDQKVFACYESKAMRGKHKRAGEPIARKVIERRKDRNPMIKFVIIGIIAVVAFAGWKLSHTKLPGFGAPTAVPQEVKAVAGKQGVKAYEVRSEILRAHSGPYVATDDHEYEIGRMNEEGRVMGMDGNVIRLDTHDGRVLYIMTTRTKRVDIPRSIPVSTPDGSGKK